LRPVDAKVERYRDMISYCVGAAGMSECNLYTIANHRTEHSAYQATRDAAVKALLPIFKGLAENYVQGNVSKEDLKPQKKEQVRSLLALVGSSRPTSATSARATARKRPVAAPAAKGPVAKKPAAAGAAAPPARPAAAGSVTRRPAAAAAAGAEAAPAAAASAAAASGTAVPPVAKPGPVPAAALGRTAAKAADTQLEQEEEEEDEEVFTYMPFCVFSQSGVHCICVWLDEAMHRQALSVDPISLGSSPG